ncbi:MAG: hypothetical protein AVDCRST_MAG51-2337, partial [uncultured Ramlibacter sp.]
RRPEAPTSGAAASCSTNAKRWMRPCNPLR